MDSIAIPRAEKRLIVILPGNMAGNMELAHKIYRLAVQEQANVLYLTLVNTFEQKLTLLTRTTTMKASTLGETVCVDSILTGINQWQSTLRQILRPEDTIVCLDEQTVKTGFLQTRPIRLYLRDLFPNPIFSLEGFYQPRSEQGIIWLKAVLFWVGSLAILILFSMLEIQVDSQLHGLFRIALLVMLLFTELGSVLAWNRVTDY